MFFSSNVTADISKSYEGYEVFNKYCFICHGEEGKGDGPLAKKLKTPPANLTDNARLEKRTDKELVRIVEGTSPHGTVSSDMPSWRNAISNSQVRSLVAYIRYLHRGKHALPGNPGLGKKVYDSYCVQCHGPHGKADGVLTRVYSMEPVDHTDAERMNKITNKKLSAIITDGGTGSSLMPGWEGVLTEDEINAVISYIRLIAAH
jgi:cytochrome c oxidase cbb3-type subunit 3